MATVVLESPSKLDQAAALMLTVFKENPDTRVTRREIESVLNLGEFSVSTRWRALNHLASQGLIREETRWPNGGASTYWMPSEE